MYVQMFLLHFTRRGPLSPPLSCETSALQNPLKPSDFPSSHERKKSGGNEKPRQFSHHFHKRIFHVSVLCQRWKVLGAHHFFVGLCQLSTTRICTRIKIMILPKSQHTLWHINMLNPCFPAELFSYFRYLYISFFAVVPLSFKKLCPVFCASFYGRFLAGKNFGDSGEKEGKALYFASNVHP